MSFQRFLGCFNQHYKSANANCDENCVSNSLYDDGDKLLARCCCTGELCNSLADRSVNMTRELPFTSPSTGNFFLEYITNHVIY